MASASKARWFIVITAFGAAISILVGIKTLGCVLPTEALAKKDAFTIFETKENAKSTYDRLDIANSSALLGIQTTLRDIETCLRTRTCGILSEPDAHE